jgi:CRP-like cAMP-binding protein
LTISAAEYRRFAAEDVAVQIMIIHDQELLFSKTQISAARFACLSVDVRMAACFIEVADLVGSDNLPLTQEALAEMLSVQRTSVTAAAGKLRAEGTIAYARGKIQIQDRARYSIGHAAVLASLSARA